MLRPGGWTAFYSILVTPGLDAADRRRAARLGPPAVATSGAYPRMLRSAGFADVEEVDVTDAYLDAIRSWVRHAGTLADGAAGPVPDQEFTDALARRRAATGAIENGLLGRSLFLGRRPETSTSRG